MTLGILYFIILKNIDYRNEKACNEYLLLIKNENNIKKASDVSKMDKYVKKNGGILQFRHYKNYNSILGIPSCVVYAVDYGNNTSENLKFYFDMIGEIGSVYDGSDSKIENLYDVKNIQK